MCTCKTLNMQGVLDQGLPPLLVYSSAYFAATPIDRPGGRLLPARGPKVSDR